MKCNHMYTMVYDDDFCACYAEGCNEQWRLTPKGWVSNKISNYFKEKNNYGKYRNKRKSQNSNKFRSR